MLAMCLVLLDVGLATAQPFRITFRRERDEPSSIVLVGELFNDGLRDVVERTGNERTRLVTRCARRLVTMTKTETAHAPAAGARQRERRAHA